MAKTCKQSTDGGACPAGAFDLAAVIAALQHLDAGALRRRWRALVGGVPPPSLGRPLALRILAYKLQAARLGDLDRASLRELESAHKSSAGGRMPDRPLIAGADASAVAPAVVDAGPPCPARLRPGTVLMREHGGVLHRVIVLSDGFAWHGTTYASLSHAAFAITGTRWNGPRFFGLRGKPAKQADDARTQLLAGVRRRTRVDGASRGNEALGSNASGCEALVS